VYDGLLTVVPCEEGFSSRERKYNVRIDEAGVKDIAFLEGARVPTLAVLYKHLNEQMHLRTYVLSLTDKTAMYGPWPAVALVGAPSMLIPVPQPVGGVLVVGRTQIAWHGGKRPDDVVTYPLPAGTSLSPACFGAIDSSRFLIGDADGHLFLLALSTEASSSGSGVTLSSMALDPLGEGVLPSTLSYLDEGRVFVGSKYGDPALIKIIPDRDAASGKNFVVEATWPNLGPIVDLCVQDLDRAGQGQVVCASGAYKDGSLRIVRNGIGIEEVVDVPLAGIRSVWGLRDATTAAHHKYLVQSLSMETRVIISEGGSLEEASPGDLPGLNLAVPTLCCANMGGDLLLQVTAAEVRLVRASNCSAVSFWPAPAGTRITVAGANAVQVLLALSNKAVHLLELEGGVLVAKGKRTMAHDVACINVNPLEAAGAMDEDAPALARASLGAIGLWTEVSLHLVNLAPGGSLGLLEDVAVEAVGGAVPPRSTLLVSLRGAHHAFLGLGDGMLYSFRLEATGGGLPRLADRKGVQLGRQSIALSAFWTAGATAVFAACDRPTVIYAVSGTKLAYSNVNLSDVSAMAPFSTPAVPDCLALVKADALVIGAVDSIQKLHVRTISLGEQPRKVLHLRSSGVVAVAVEGSVPSGVDGVVVEAGGIRLFDDNSFEPLVGTPFALDPHELIISVCEAALSPAPAAPFFVVGTAYVLEGEEEASKGRILIFSLDGTASARHVSLVSARDTKGAVYAVTSLGGSGRLVAACGPKVQVYEWGVGGGRSTAGGAGGEGGTGELRLIPECGYHGHTIALFLESRGDFILVGDLMKSVTLLRYMSGGSKAGTLEVTAQDPGTMWVTGMAMLDDSTFLAADHHYNLNLAERNGSTGAETEEERTRLKLCGDMHTGDFINRIAAGSLVMLPQANESPRGEDEDMVGEEEEAGAARSSKRARSGPSTAAARSGASAGVAAPSSSGCHPRFIMGAVSGALSVLISLPPPLFEYLRRAQAAMNRVLRSPGQLSHAAWRGWYSDKVAHVSTGPREDETEGARKFVDGDLLEQLLDLPAVDQERVVAHMNGRQGGGEGDARSQVPADAVLHPEGGGAAAGPATLAELVKTLEDLSRLH